MRFLLAIAILCTTPFLSFSQGTTPLISTVAGIGSEGYKGNNGPATRAELDRPAKVAFDAKGNLYIADAYNAAIRKIDASGIITTIAGNNYVGCSGDSGKATAAMLYNPVGIAFDTQGNLYIADNGNHRIRKVNTEGIITTIAGNGVPGYSGDGGPAVDAQLNSPVSVAVDGAGNVYISDRNNNRIRMVNPSGIITTVAGTGISGFSGDGGKAKAAQLSYPYGIAVDAVGNLYIADCSNVRIRKLNASGIITTIAGNGIAGPVGENIPAASAQLNFPCGIAVDASGNVFIADSYNQRIRKINTAGIITTVAGNGFMGFSGDGGIATGAQLNYPTEVGVDAAGNIYIGDTHNQRIRKVCFPKVPAITIVASANNIAPGTAVNFTGTAYNYATTPVYQWEVNDNDVGTGATTFSYTPANGDVVSCTITADNGCGTSVSVTSNPVTIKVGKTVAKPVKASKSKTGSKEK